MASLANPFNGPEQACIPDFPALMSGKQRVWARGTFSTSSNALAGGFGYIIGDPKWASANDSASIVHNLPADPTTAIDFGTGAQGYTNSQYNFAMHGNNGITRRVVSAGLRIRYTGSELIRGGRIVGLHHPNHNTINGGTQASLLAYKEAESLPIERDVWTTILYRPVEQSDYDFGSDFPAIGATSQCFYMGFAIQAFDTTGANTQAFEYEFFVNFEFQGAVIVNKTPSHIDAAGHGAVNAITNMSPAIVKPSQIDSTHLMRAAVTAASQYLFTSTSKPSAPPLQPPAPKETGGSFWKDLLGFASAAVPAVLSLL